MFEDFEDKISENIPELVKDNKPQFQEAQQNPHLALEILQDCTEKRSLKHSRDRDYHKAVNGRLKAEFSALTAEARK